MVDILHRVGISAPADEVYAALTTINGLAGWWTERTTGDGEVGGVIQFRFEGAPALGGFDMKVLDAEPGELVLWEVIDGPEEWLGTQIRFELSREDGFTIVLFSHEGWSEPIPFLHHCSTRWATYLMSLKSFVETGTGQPSPHEVAISNWV